MSDDSVKNRCTGRLRGTWLIDVPALFVYDEVNSIAPELQRDRFADIYRIDYAESAQRQKKADFLS